MVAARLHVLLIHFHDTSTTDVLHYSSVMGPVRDNFVGVVISGAVSKADGRLGCRLHVPIAKLKNVATDNLLDPHRCSPVVVVVWPGCLRGPCTGRSQRLIGEIPAFTSTNPLAQLAVCPCDYLLAHRVRHRPLLNVRRSSIRSYNVRSAIAPPDQPSHREPPIGTRSSMPALRRTAVSADRYIGVRCSRVRRFHHQPTPFPGPRCTRH
jgi:hypothetical protein